MMEDLLFYAALSTKPEVRLLFVIRRRCLLSESMTQKCGMIITKIIDYLSAE